MNRPFIIAEIGINHNGDIEIAKKLIDAAKFTGCNAVKFQKRDINIVYTKELLDSPRESPWGTTQRDQKKKLEFTESEYETIDSYCKIKDIIWFASAWDNNSLKFLDRFNLSYNKIASAMIVDINFLKEVARRKKHTFISTGMSTDKDIETAVKIFKDLKCPFELMHCVSTYPTKVQDVNLSTINFMKEKFKCDVGYSGHENGITVSLSAVSLGISSLERHITLDRTMYGSDQAASLEPRGFMEMNSRIDSIIKAIGTPKYGFITEEEKIIAKKLRAHIKN
jgi:N-acetylneuraminate synthase